MNVYLTNDTFSTDSQTPININIDDNINVIENEPVLIQKIGNFDDDIDWYSSSSFNSCENRSCQDIYDENKF